MADAADYEPETDPGPRWHKEMHRLLEQAPINLCDVTPGFISYELVTKYGIGSDFWKNL
jgi:hypothetical protein